jgi:hypothetical protein
MKFILEEFKKFTLNERFILNEAETPIEIATTATNNFKQTLDKSSS